MGFLRDLGKRPSVPRHTLCGQTWELSFTLANHRQWAKQPWSPEGLWEPSDGGISAYPLFVCTGRSTFRFERV